MAIKSSTPFSPDSSSTVTLTGDQFSLGFFAGAVPTNGQAQANIRSVFTGDGGVDAIILGGNYLPDSGSRQKSKNSSLDKLRDTVDKPLYLGIGANEFGSDRSADLSKYMPSANGSYCLHHYFEHQMPTPTHAGSNSYKDPSVPGVTVIMLNTFLLPYDEKLQSWLRNRIRESSAQHIILVTNQSLLPGYGASHCVNNADAYADAAKVWLSRGQQDAGQVAQIHRTVTAAQEYLSAVAGPNYARMCQWVLENRVLNAVRLKSGQSITLNLAAGETNQQIISNGRRHVIIAGSGGDSDRSSEVARKQAGESSGDLLYSSRQSGVVVLRVSRGLGSSLDAEIWSAHTSSAVRQSRDGAVGASTPLLSAERSRPPQKLATLSIRSCAQQVECVVGTSKKVLDQSVVNRAVVGSKLSIYELDEHVKTHHRAFKPLKTESFSSTYITDDRTMLQKQLVSLQLLVRHFNKRIGLCLESADRKGITRFDDFDRYFTSPVEASCCGLFSSIGSPEAPRFAMATQLAQKFQSVILGLAHREALVGDRAFPYGELVTRLHAFVDVLNGCLRVGTKINEINFRSSQSFKDVLDLLRRELSRHDQRSEMLLNDLRAMLSDVTRLVNQLDQDVSLTRVQPADQPRSTATMAPTSSRVRSRTGVGQSRSTVAGPASS